MIKCLLTEAVLALTVSLGGLAQPLRFSIDIIADRAPQPLMEVELYRSRIIRPSTISGCGAGPPVQLHLTNVAEIPIELRALDVFSGNVGPNLLSVLLKGPVREDLALATHRADSV